MIPSAPTIVLTMFATSSTTSHGEVLRLQSPQRPHGTIVLSCRFTTVRRALRSSQRRATWASTYDVLPSGRSEPLIATRVAHGPLASRTSPLAASGQSALTVVPPPAVSALGEGTARGRRPGRSAVLIDERPEDVQT